MDKTVIFCKPLRPLLEKKDEDINYFEQYTLNELCEIVGTSNWLFDSKFDEFCLSKYIVNKLVYNDKTKRQAIANFFNSSDTVYSQMFFNSPSIYSFLSMPGFIQHQLLIRTKKWLTFDGTIEEYKDVIKNYYSLDNF